MREVEGEGGGVERGEVWVGVGGGGGEEEGLGEVVGVCGVERGWSR